MEFEIEISCCLCMGNHKIKIQLPDGWSSRYDGATVDTGFCPEHSLVADWAESQCPGCVGSWANCSLWKAFAYQGHRDLTEADFAKIRNGICPRRTNGTFGFSDETGKLEAFDLSEKGASESGIAFEKAIKDYIEKYA